VLCSPSPLLRVTTSPLGVQVADKGAVRYLFASTRWKNPDGCAEDLEQMRVTWKEMCDSSMAFAGQCSFDRMVKVISKYRQGWEESSSKASRKVSRRRNGVFEGGKEGPPIKRQRADGSPAANSSRKQNSVNALDIDTTFQSVTSAIPGMGGAGVAGGNMRSPFIPALMQQQGGPGAMGHGTLMGGADNTQYNHIHQQALQGAMTAAMQQMLANGNTGMPPQLPSFNLSHAGIHPEQPQTMPSLAGGIAAGTTPHVVPGVGQQATVAKTEAGSSQGAIYAILQQALASQATLNSGASSGPSAPQPTTSAVTATSLPTLGLTLPYGFNTSMSSGSSVKGWAGYDASATSVGVANALQFNANNGAGSRRGSLIDICAAASGIAASGSCASSIGSVSFGLTGGVGGNTSRRPSLFDSGFFGNSGRRGSLTDVGGLLGQGGRRGSLTDVGGLLGHGGRRGSLMGGDRCEPSFFFQNHAGLESIAPECFLAHVHMYICLYAYLMHAVGVL
jgi:hypothetical protein